MPLTRRTRLVSAITAGAVAYAAALGGAVAGGAAAADPRPVPAPTPTASSAAPTPTPTPTEVARPVPAAPAAPSPIRTCSVSAEAADGRLGSFQGRVVNAVTGEVLFDRGGDIPSRAASVMKVLTSAAALSVLGPDHRLATRVVRGAEPGTVVLVGGGDPTLSRTPSGSTTAYPGAAHLDDLAAQVRAAWSADPATAGTPITTVVLDASYFAGDDWEPSWARSELTGGYMPEITALMVDGDRSDPYANTSVRSDDPVQRAGDAFAAALGAGGTVRGTAPAGAPVLGQVESQPVSTLVQQSLLVSDNALAEALARVTAIEAGAGNTFGSLQAGVTSGLAAYGVDSSALRIVDGSGLSDNNAIPPSYLTSLLIKVQNREGALWAVYDGLPISGQTGSLRYSDRFSGAASRADGAVHAKTGWIETGYTLAGTIDAADGTPLTFAIYALGDVRDNAKQAIDTWTAAVWDCGNNLANH
ncbi:D-alanyl-D-alanine carboxypeptidase [Naasia sp. SYSU D00057]|uniref:D-alanyl-D-alanine carboxypeptidase/D-alanyl-D-alanine-endopeptidase n=1 Tax=Naasia sp. SYSU D00057 TaxID=2817380 RepID=UPI0027DC4A23|nr:D-alanyl-D-alanine carboxypeptidase [Naasia sp. SYSU D00057]